MKRILITGATGNIGFELIHYLMQSKSDCEVIAAGRPVEKMKKRFQDDLNLSFVPFDFENTDSFKAAFKEIDILFLLRPPHISEVEKYFRPLLNSAKEHGIDQVVFLSVQGAEQSKVIPHNKIERLIEELEFSYIFLRPSYFMQNLTTTLLPEIVKERSITLPSGNAKFNWIDIRNIGEATAKLILRFEEYENKSLEITGSENENFTEVARLISEITGEKISFESMNPFRFYFKKRKEGMERGFAMVKTMLHFLPRFHSEPHISGEYQLLTGKNPTTLRDFIEREKELITTPWQNSKPLQES